MVAGNLQATTNAFVFANTQSELLTEFVKKWNLKAQLYQPHCVLEHFCVLVEITTWTLKAVNYGFCFLSIFFEIAIFIDPNCYLIVKYCFFRAKCLDMRHLENVSYFYEFWSYDRVCSQKSSPDRACHDLGVRGSPILIARVNILKKIFIFKN